MRSVYVKNTIILSFCMLVVKFLGAIYRIVLSNILGTTGIGMYQFVFPVYSLFLVFITGAMPTYISQKIASSKYDNKQNYSSKILSKAIFVCLFFETIFTLILCFGGKYISILQKSQNEYSYIIISLSLVFSSISSVFKGYFNGKENMVPSAVSGILEQLLKLFFGLSFSILLKPYGTNFSVYGAFFGVLVSEILSFLYLLFKFKKSKIKIQKTYMNFKDTKNLFLEFLPISLANLILPISTFIDSFLVVNVLSFKGVELNSAISLFGIATGMIAPIINFPIMLCSTIQTALLPRLSFKIANNEDVKEIINGTYFFVLCLVVPCVFGILALPKNIILVFFPSIEKTYILTAVRYLQIFSINIFIVSLCQICISVLNAYGKFKQPLKSQIVALCFKICIFIGLSFLTNLNILALCVSSVVSNFLGFLVSLYYVKKVHKIKIKAKKVVLIFLGSFVMFLMVYYLNILLKFNLTVKTLCLILFAVVFYFMFLFLSKVVDIKELKLMFGLKNKYKTKNF